MEYLFPLLFIAVIFTIRVINKKLGEDREAEDLLPPVSSSPAIPNNQNMKKQNSRFANSASIHSDPQKKEKSSSGSSDEESTSLLQSEESQESPFTLSNAEDARKAIIYSEIINRKY